MIIGHRRRRRHIIRLSPVQLAILGGIGTALGLLGILGLAALVSAAGAL